MGDYLSCHDDKISIFENTSSTTVKTKSDLNAAAPQPEEIKKLVTLFEQRKYPEGEELARSLTVRFPEHGFGWKVLGVLLKLEGRLEEAISAMRRAVILQPDDYVALSNLGHALRSAGRLVEAEESYRAALALKEDSAEAHGNLGIVLNEQGRFSESETSYRRALDLNPDYVEVYYNLGNTLLAQRRLPEAETSYLQALKCKPDFVDAFNNLGNLLKEQGRITEAEACIQKALSLRPNSAEAYNNLGSIFSLQGRLAEAEETLNLALDLRPDFAEAYNNLGMNFYYQGRFDKAVTCYRRAISLKSDFSAAYNNLGMILRCQGQWAESEAHYRHALELNPDFAEAYNNLGINFHKQGRLSEAAACFYKAINLKSEFVEAYTNLGMTLQGQGYLAESEALYRYVLEIKPEYVKAFSNLLFVLNYHPDKNSEEIYKEYKKFNSQFGLPRHIEWQPHKNDRTISRRLKIGYVSGDFCNHSVRHFLEPLIANHDKAKVEVYAYAENAVEDEVTGRYKKYMDHWVPTMGMSDIELTDRIRLDSIDVLVDLSGHTDKNRLEVFARKPAPVSVSWLGYGYTTGLTAIDYFLTDTSIVPPGSEGVFAETPWRLDTPAAVYRPAEGMGEVSPLPAKIRKYITFGSLSRAIRINHRTIRVWAEIMKQVKGSHLVINSGDFRDRAMQDELAAKFVAQDIGRERLEISCNSPPWDVLRGLDIGLDCFPHNSGTTLTESLYMGIPFVTLAGRPSVGRIGSSILEGVGHPEWIARTEDEYVELAVNLAADLSKLESLRTHLRAEMECGPWMSEQAFACKVEEAYKEMFAKWCQGVPATIRKEGFETQETLDLSYDIILQKAVAHHQAGQFQEAERLYLDLLHSQPNHATINYNLGVLAVQMKRPAAGLPYFEVALDANPEDGAYWLSYIDALDQVGQSESARQILEVAKQAGLQGDEVDALAARLVQIPEKNAKTNRKQASYRLNEKTSKNKKKKTKSEKITGGKQRLAEPSTHEINAMVSSFTEGDFEKAEKSARAMVMRYPRHGFAWKILGPILSNKGQPGEALLAARKAATLLPGDYSTHYNLGIILYNQRKYLEAESCYRRALQLNPNYAEAYNNLGNALRAQKNYVEAETNVLRALELNPNLVEANNILANIVSEQGRFKEAEHLYRHALNLRGNDPELLSNLGNVLKDQGWFAEAERYYRMALSLKTDSAEILSNLGLILKEKDQIPEAEECCRRALKLDPKLAEAHNNLGLVLARQSRYREAEDHYRHALELKPNYAEAYCNLAPVLGHQNRIVEAEFCCRRALECKTDFLQAYNNLLFLINYDPDKSGEEIFEEYKKFNSQFGLPYHKEWQPHKNDRTFNRRLKIGYVSGDFYKHSVRHFLEPLVANHDKAKVEVFAYAAIVVEDEVTERYKKYMDHWVSTVGMSDIELSERIRLDSIDILIDLSGHTEKNRLGVFARKPAPISVSWLGYGCTTGLTSIDYFLTDTAIAPIGSEGVFSETPWRLATPAAVYRPAEDMGEVSPLPAQERGYITFGTLTRAIRINHRTIRIWVEILQRVPGSHLVINSGNFKDPAMQTWLTDKFVAQGIDRARLEIGCNSPPWDVLRGLDIGLDCFPHNSGTTLFENLYMGVPFITLAGRPSVGRLGACVLEGVGHREWIAETEEEYVERAVALAADLPRLASLRAGLRAEMGSGPLMDEPAFVRKVEAAYRQMFAKWCKEQQ